MAIFKCYTALLVVFLLFSCSDTPTAEYTLPQQLNDGWQVAAPADAGLDERKLAKAIQKNNDGVDGFVVVKDGKLVAEAYYNEYMIDRPHKVWSVTKSVVSALAGIATDRGEIKSVTDSFGRYMGGYNVPDAQRTITIEHLLSMTSGIAWNEMGGEQSAGFRIAYSPEWINFMLQLPMAQAPCTGYNYSTGNYVLLAPVIKNATGMQADEYADRYLFGPLNITNYQWTKCAEFWTKQEGGELPGAQKPEPAIEYPDSFSQYPHTGAGLLLLPRDMAKIGQLYLQSGKWNGQQVVSESWVKNSTQPHFGNMEYGYGWRMRTFNIDNEELECYYASGFGLQEIFVFPAYEMVVVFTQSHYRSMPRGGQQMEDVLREYILKAVL